MKASTPATVWNEAFFMSSNFYCGKGINLLAKSKVTGTNDWKEPRVFAFVKKIVSCPTINLA